ncbi:MAG: hypothetical protein IPK00_14170 [Deltaproteobacteria bacterium]|nr:hypothetical protein [Deltaproteobacteria bacterium]
MPRCRNLAALLVLRTILMTMLLATTAAFPAEAVSVETFVIAIGGQTQPLPGFACTTFAPASPGIAFFVNTTPSVPLDGLANCGIAGLFRTIQLASNGPSSDTTSLSTSFAQNTFSGSSLALARIGGVLAEAHATFLGPSNSLITEGAASYALFEDRLTATSPSVAAGTPGTIRMRFSIAGELSVTGPPPFSSVADVELNYSVGSSGSFLLMRAQATRADLVPFATSGTGAPLAGFTLAPGSFSGAGEVDSFQLPITWGSPFAVKMGLLAGAIPGSGATTDVDFSQGATLTGIQLFANGVPIQDFSIEAESGTAYGASGVPEPTSGAMVVSGTLALVAAYRRRPLRSEHRSD